MNILIDTCVVIDFLQGREPFADAARALFRAIAMEECHGFITAKSATDIYYLTHRCTHSDEETRKKLSALLGLVSLLDTAADDITRALLSKLSDFEDAVMVETALRTNMKAIVTRNEKDFQKAPLPIYTPEEFLEMLLPQ